MRLLCAALLVALAGCATDPSEAGNTTTVVSNPDAPTPPDVEYDEVIVQVASAEALVDDVVEMDAETVVLNFWATWCVPCREEFPEFTRFDAEMQDEGVHVRFVSLDQPQDLNMVRAFLAEHDVADPSYLYTGQGDVTSQLNPFVGNAIPITMILSGDGIVQHTHVGRLTYDELVRTVQVVRDGGDPSTLSDS